MPTIKKLGKPDVVPANSVKPESVTPEAIVTENGKPVALIESKPASDTKLPAVRIPSFMQSAMPEVAERELTGYIGFAHSMSKNYAQMQVSGINEGDIFLYIKQQYHKVPQLEFFLCHGQSFKSVMDSSGKFSHVTRDLSEKVVTLKAPGKNPKTGKIEIIESLFELKPHYVCLCIVNLNGTLVPIKGDFIGTKSAGIEAAIAAVTAAGSADSGWSRLSDAHRVTMSFPEAFGRVYHTMRTKAEVAKSSGMSYHRSVCVSTPATVPQMQALIGALSNDEFNASLEEAYKNYETRIEFMDTCIRDGGQK